MNSRKSPFRTCRYCHRQAPKVDLLAYSCHHIHPRCALLKWGALIGRMLPAAQLARLPVGMLREFDLLETVAGMLRDGVDMTSDHQPSLTW